MWSININGMKPSHAQKWKVKALSETLKTKASKVPFVVIMESHFKPHHNAAEIHIEGYNIHRADRISSRKNAGVAIYYQDHLVTNDTLTYSDDYCQAVALYIKSLNTIVGGVYRPPNSTDIQVNSFKSLINKLSDFIKKYPTADLQLYGDFNLKFIQWNSLSLKPGHGEKLSEQHCAEALITFMQENFLTQLVTENTRKNTSILDLVITNNAEIIHSIEIEKTKLSDHDLLRTKLISEKFVHINTNENYKPDHPFDKLNWHKAKWEPIKKDLKELNWKELLENKDVNEMCIEINNKVSDIASNHCPKHKLQESKCAIPRCRRAMIRARRHTLTKINILKYVKIAKTEQEQIIKNKKIEKLQAKVSQLEDDIRQNIEEEVKRKEEEVIRKIKSNPRAFYSYANRKRKRKCKIGPLIDSEGNLQSDPKVMADLLQKQYVKIFSEEDNTPDNGESTEPDSDTNVLSDIEFSEEDIIKAISSMPEKSSPGPDKFPSILLKKCKDELSVPLYILWRKSLDTGKVPIGHKQQTIVPIYKKDSKAKPQNYRPVSLTSHILKIFERVLRERIVRFIEENNLLSNDQYGFRPGRSTILQLLVHIDRVIEILENNKNADVLYLDFAKAFDKVCHKTLLKKLEGFGIQGKLLEWIRSFLSDRYQRVVVEGKLSEPEKVRSGVPQGTVLGPVLFILYINNITEILKNALIKIFADDSKLIKEIENEEDRRKLMEDLNAVLKWAEDNKMELNDTKFMLLQHGKQDNLKQPYRINENVILEKAEYAKDLGILVDSELKFNQQIDTCTTSASQIAGWTLRVFHSRSKEVMLVLYKALIRPKLEYGCMVFHPQQIGEISKLESVQRTFTHRIENMDTFNYWERLQVLGLYSVQRRRERFICVQMFKIHKGLIPNNLQLEFYETPRYGPMCRRRKLISKSTRINSLRCNSFRDVGAKLFNILPKHLKEAQTKDSFKRKLDKMLSKLPDRPPIPGYVRQNDNSIWDWLRSERISSITALENAAEEVEALETGVVKDTLPQPNP